MNLAVQIGNDFHGYIRQVRIQQNWHIEEEEIGNIVNDTCAEYPVGSGNTCDFCSPIWLDTHDADTCYVKCPLENSYGPDCIECNWKCLRCDGPNENDCF